MRRIFLLSVLSMSLLSATAQDSIKLKQPPLWKTGGSFELMVGQAGARNWATIGTEKFALTGLASLHLWANRNWKKSEWENTADLSYGMVKFYSGDSRKIDDKIDIYSKFGRRIKNMWSVGLVGSLRSQFTNGYDLTVSPKKRVSGFFAPAYLTLSPGMQLKTQDASFGFHAGPAVRWVIVTNAPYSLVYQGGVKPDGSTERTLADLYGVSAGKQVRVEAGLFFSATYKKELMKNVYWNTRVDVNSDFTRDDPFNLDVYWTNRIAMTVNRWLRVNYNFDLYKDNDVRMFGRDKNETAVQLKSILAIALSVSF
jgi:hypothetical protein